MKTILDKKAFYTSRTEGLPCLLHQVQSSRMSTDCTDTCKYCFYESTFIKSTCKVTQKNLFLQVFCNNLWFLPIAFARFNA